MLLRRVSAPRPPLNPKHPFFCKYFRPPGDSTKDELKHEQFRKELNSELSITNRAYWTRRIHELCTVHGEVDLALQLLHHLRLRGYNPDSLNLSSLIHALCRACRFPDAHHCLLLFLSLGCVPDERTSNVLVARLLDARAPRSTLRVIHALVKVKPDFVPSLTNYNRLIHQLCESSRPCEAHRLFLDMKIKGHSPSAVSYTTLIGGYCKVGELDLACRLFDEMSESGVEPNVLTHSVLICGFLRRRKTEKGKELMGRLWKSMVDEQDIHINHAAFSNLIGCLCREGLFHEVFNIAEEMPQGKSVHEGFAYAQMIDSLCCYGRYNGAARIVYMMRKRRLTPSLVSYNSIVHGLCTTGDSLRAYQLLEEGVGFGYFPSEFTYKDLVEGLCRDYRLDKANDVLKIMLNKEKAGKTRIYNIYLRALSLMNNPAELLNVLVLMLQTQCQPDVITLNTVINGFCKMGRTEEALKILCDMMMGKFCSPDGVTFTTVICGLLEEGKVEEALDFLHNSMPDKGFNPSVITYNAVLRGLFKLHRVDEAMEIYGSIMKGGIAADCITYTIIIDGLCEFGRLDEAKKFWDDVIWPSKVHDNFVYSAIVKGLCCSGKLSEACDFLYELADCGVTLSNVNYNIVIDCACKLGLKREAYQILGEMRKNGLTPDSVTWRILDKMHVNVGQQFAEYVTSEISSSAM